MSQFHQKIILLQWFKKHCSELSEIWFMVILLTKSWILDTTLKEQNIIICHNYHATDSKVKNEKTTGI
jgi:hypothetical protein